MSEQGRSLREGDPTHVGDYELVGRLGAGGMGVVYLGKAPSGQLVAVKVVHDAYAHDPEFRARFRSEVARARQVPPFCTAEVLDADPDATRPYLVVEYVDGPTLGDEVKAKGPLSASNLHAVAVGIATALTVIHEAGVIHRDLKPGNVLLAPGSPKVIDFGIARAMEAGTQHTRTGVVMGSINYMSPERFDEPTVALTPAADIFAWGCVIAYAGTGHAPFEAESTMATLAKIISQKPSLDGMADGPLRRLVTQALATDPAQRPTARELLSQLLSGDPTRSLTAAQAEPRKLAALGNAAAEAEAAAGGLGVAPVKTRPRGRTAVIALACAVAVLAVALGAGIAIYNRPGHTRTEQTSADTPIWLGDGSSTAAVPSKDTGGPAQPPVKASDATGANVYGPYFIYNFATGMCVDIPGTGPGTQDGPVLQDVCQKTTADNQEFVFLPDGTDSAGYQQFLIRNTADNLCLDVPDAGPVDDGTPITEFPCTQNDNQDYRLEPQFTTGGRQYYRLVDEVAGKCLDVDGVKTGGSGAKLTLVTCVSGDDHEWALVRRSAW